MSVVDSFANSVDAAVAAAIEEIVALERAGKLAEARERALAGAREAREHELVAEARFLARASELALYTQGIEQAEILADQACRRARDENGPDSLECRAEASMALARVCLRKHASSALEQARAALDDIAGQEPDQGADGPVLSPWHRATLLKLRGLVWARGGKPRQALSCFARAYDLARGYPALRARILLAWAVQLRNWGAFDDARRKVERSLEIRLELGDHYGAAMCYGSLAFIYQRQGMWERERDALTADLRMCQRIGGTADVPGLHARLAGALIGLGKYAGAWAEAEIAIAEENQRLGLEPPDDDDDDDDDDPGHVDAGAATRVHAFAWREQARVCLAQDRIAQGLDLVTRAGAVFERLGDSYGHALCGLTEAQLALHRVKTASDPDLARTAGARIDEIIAATQPVFVRLGALPEAAEAIVIQAEAGALLGHAGPAADRIAQQVLPMLQQAGLGTSASYRRARACLHRIAPERDIERIVTQSAMLRTLVAVVTETEPQPGTAVAARVGEYHQARAFALAAMDLGAVVSWPDSHTCLAVTLGPGHEERAAELVAAASALHQDAATAKGDIDLEHMWPAGIRVRGEPVAAALASLDRTSAPDTRHSEGES